MSTLSRQRRQTDKIPANFVRELSLRLEQIGEVLAAADVLLRQNELPHRRRTLIDEVHAPHRGGQFRLWSLNLAWPVLQERMRLEARSLTPQPHAECGHLVALAVTGIKQLQCRQFRLFHRCLPSKSQRARSLRDLSTAYPQPINKLPPSNKEVHCTTNQVFRSRWKSSRLDRRAKAWATGVERLPLARPGGSAGAV